MPKQPKTIFIAFPMKDVTQRDFLKGQSLLTSSPFEYIDMSVKEPYDDAWKKRVRTRIRRSDGVIALVSSNTSTSRGEKWEIKCALEEGKPLVGLWAYKDDRTKPDALAGVRIMAWTWSGITKFIDSL